MDSMSRDLEQMATWGLQVAWEVVFDLFILYVEVFCLLIRVCTMCVPVACEGQKRAFPGTVGPLELELWVVVRDGRRAVS